MAPPAWTDLRQNLLTLPISVPEIQEAFSLGKKLPPKYMPLFLHEFTHHWCYQNTVGSSLALLHLRMIMLFANVDVENQSYWWSLSEAILRYKAAWRLLNPAIEGLALFAEHDASPSGSPAISLPAMRTIRFFIRPYPKRDTTEEIEQKWCRMLNEYRTSGEGVERKVSLLLEGFSGERWSYPVGYLSMRTLHRMASARSERLHDRDFFLAYAGSFIFSDDVLASLLLSTEPTGFDWVRAFQRRLSDRLRLLATASDIDARASEFEQILSRMDSGVDLGDAKQIAKDAIATQTNLEFERFFDLLEEAQRREKNNHKLTAWSLYLEDDTRSVWDGKVIRFQSGEDVEALLGPEVRDYWLRHYLLDTLHRSLIRLAKESAEIEVDGSGLIWATMSDKRRGRLVAEPPSVLAELGFEPPSPGRAPGSLALYWSVEADAVVLLCFRGTSVVAINRDRKKLFPSPLLISAISASLKEAIAEESLIIRGFDETNIPLFGALPKMLKQVETWGRSMWYEYALAHLPKSRRKAVARSFAKNGLYNAFGADIDLMRGFAVLSAHHAARTPIDKIERGLMISNLPAIKDIRARCLAAQEATGIPLLSAKADLLENEFFV